MGLDAVALHDELLANKPADARHDADICPFCADKAAQGGQSSASVSPPVSDRSGAPTVPAANTEGGTTEIMSTDTQQTMTVETHEALLEKALREATSATEAALERKTQELAEATSKVEELAAKTSELEADNARLNGELDKAQIDLKTATDKAAALEADIAKREEETAKAEIASKRAEQVKTLGLFSEEYVQEKASKWADIADDAWDEQLAEWRLIKPADAASSEDGTDGSHDSASAMTGTSGSLTTDPNQDSAAAKSPSARRAALGLS